MAQAEVEAVLERETELARLAGALERGAAGAGAVVAIEGPPGIGKSELLAATRTLAGEREMRVLGARGGELEREFSYGVVRHLFEPALRSAGPDHRAALLSGAAGHAASLFEPALGAWASPADGSFALVHGLFWLAANVAAERPLLLAIDDLHWSDQPSLRFVDYLGRRLEGLPIVLAATLRPDEPGADGLLLDSFAAGLHVTRLAPRPLSPEAAAKVVGATLSTEPDPAFCRACHLASDGNPLLLRELVRALANEHVAPTAEQTKAVMELGAKALSRSVGLRLRRLAPEVSRFAQAAAVLADGALLRHAAELAGLDDDAAYSAVATLSRLDILRPERAVEFVHPLVRAAVYAGLRPGEPERAHARAAQVLAATGEAPERIAAHLLRVPPAGDEAAAATLRNAARRSLAAGDAGAATSYLHRALEEPPLEGELPDVLFELGSAEAMTQGQGAADHLAAALRLSDDPQRRTAIAELLSRALFMSGAPEQAVEVSERVIEDLGDAHPELRRRLEAALLSATLDEPALAHVAAAIAARARATDHGADFGAKALDALLAWRDARALAVPAADAVARAERALEGGVLLAEDPGGVLSVVAADVHAVADSELALRAYAAGLAAARERGSILAFGANKVLRSRTHLRRGALADALADAEEGVAASETYGVAINGPMPLASLADALMERGELDAAGEALSRTEPGGELLETWHWTVYRDSQARLLALGGEVRRALAETLRCGQVLEAIGVRNPAFLAWRSRAALCLTELGEDPLEARRLVAEELELARAWGAPRALGIALRVSGLLKGGQSGLDLLREAVAVLEDSPARLEHARALTDLGAVLRRANRRSEARDPLRAGMDLAERCGAAPLTERARTELRAAGARPRRALVRGAGSLTPSEQRVARLAAEGQTNREIAQKLFVTPKTIEVHLSHAYGKLDISSRSELRRALAAAR